MLLVAGTNRNVGKTTFACRLIKHISKKQNVVAIKITPHIHKLCNTCKIIYTSKGLIVSEETCKKTTKDSSKMLAAGAQKVFYVQANDNYLNKAIEILTPLIPDNYAVICESAALRNIVKPGLFVLMSTKDRKDNNKNIDKIPLADFHFYDYNYKVKDFDFKNSIWIG